MPFLLLPLQGKCYHISRLQPAHERCCSGVRHTLTGRDTETVGCDPSLSSIPVRDQRSFADALAEVAAWLAAPGRGREVLLLYLDDQPHLLEWVRINHRRATWQCLRSGFMPLQCMKLVPG